MFLGMLKSALYIKCNIMGQKMHLHHNTDATSNAAFFVFFFTCGKLRQVLLLLGFIPKKQNALETDRLVGSQSDANTHVMTTNDLNQTGIL